MELTGSPEDYGWHLDGLQGSQMNLDQIQGAEAKVLALLKNVKSEGAMTPMDISLELNRISRGKRQVSENASIGERLTAMHEAKQAGAFSQDHIRKVCSKLHDTGKLRRRRLTEGGRGRPSYLYFNRV